MHESDSTQQTDELLDRPPHVPRPARRSGLGSMALAEPAAAAAVFGARGGRCRCGSRGVVQSAPLRAAGQARDLPLHGRRAVALRNVRREAQARRDARPADARVVHQGPADRPASEAKSCCCFGPQVKFARHGQSGQAISDLLPHIAQIADDICIVRSMQTEQINHDPAHTFMNTGTSISGRPSMGSWVTYGLGSECDDLPGLRRADEPAPARGSPQPISSRQWHSGFLPEQVPGRAVPLDGRPGPLRQQPAGRRSPRGSSDVVDTINRAQPPARRRPSTTRRSPRGSPSTSWRSACR